MITLNLAQKKLAQLRELHVVQNDSELAHGIAGALPQTQGRTIGHLCHDSVHEHFFIDEIRLTQDDQTESLEDLRADLKAFLLDLWRSILDAVVNLGLQRVNQSRSILVSAIIDDTSDSE